jgi:RNA polymerase sigma factor (sigma-70 family)
MAMGRELLFSLVRRWALPAEPDTASDAALLERFIATREEEAFRALVDRHGSLVYHVCQRILGDTHDAEDACQAVFLVLARKAATVRPREAVPAWLHGVARRVALKARSTRRRRARASSFSSAPPAAPSADPLAEISGRELVTIIDEELQRLAEVYRLPVILCCLEGRTLEQAAEQFGWTVGSVKGRLERGRARLHQRLVRRGLTLAAVEVARSTASAAVVARLVAATARGAVAFGMSGAPRTGDISARATSLAAEVLRGMALSKLMIAGALLVMSLLAAAWAIQRIAQPPSPSPESSIALRAAANVAGARIIEAPDPDDVPIEVRGRVLSPDGRPFAGARLYIGYCSRRYVQDLHSRQSASPLRAISAADGIFHFTFTTSQLQARWLDDARPAVIAVADGHGPDWRDVLQSTHGPELSLKLVEDVHVAGRILGPGSKPVAGARVVVLDVARDSQQAVARFLRNENTNWYPTTWRGPLPGQPPSVTTGPDGRFHLTGVGRDHLVRLAVEGPGIARGVLTVAVQPSLAAPSAGGIHGPTFDFVAAPDRAFRGVVRDKETSLPLPGVKVSVYPSAFAAVTDQGGRFEIAGCPRGPGYLAMAQPQTGVPYFAATACVKETEGPGPLQVDFDLVRGALLSGRVVDRSTQRPPRTVVVDYFPLFPNPHSSRVHYGTQSLGGVTAASSAVTGPDGSYSLVILPGPGAVCVSASPRNRYAAATVHERALATLFPEGADLIQGQGLCTAAGGERLDVLWPSRYHALVPICPDEKQRSLMLDLMVQPGCAVTGTVVGPAGEPLTGVEVVGLTALLGEDLLESSSFLITGLAPGASREVLFRHKERQLGKLLTVRGDSAGALTVQLDPYGSILGRIVDRAGRPVSGINLLFYANAGGLSGAAQTDGEGRFRMGLLPGRKYVLMVHSPRPLLQDVGLIEVASGVNKDLGDLPLGD